MENTSVAIVGIAFKLPEMESWEEAKYKLQSTESCINKLSEHRRKDVFGRFGEFEIKDSGYLDRVDLFDNKFFGLTENESINMSPEERMMLIYSLKSFSHAGYSIEDLKGSKTGVFYASANTIYDIFFDEVRGIGDRTPGIEGTRVANFFDLRGPVIDFNTTCSSSLTALHYACNSLLLNECEMALVGGVKISVNEKSTMNSQVITSKTDVCRPFDKDANGTLAGEGTICIVVKRLQDALKDNDYVYGVIEGSAINHGGSRTSSLVAPSSDAQKEVIINAWKKSGIHPSEIGFIEAHGTGTILGDPIEYKGIVDAFIEMNCDDAECSISSIKGQIGHLDTMSGLAGLIRLLVALNEKVIFPQAGFSVLNNHIKSDSRVTVPSALNLWKSTNGKRVGGISSFGLTGTNVHIVVSKVEDSENSSNENIFYLQLGASSANRLEENMKHLREYIENHEGIDIRNILNHVNSVFSLNTVNKGIIATSVKGLIEKLTYENKTEMSKLFLVLNLSILNFSADEIDEIVTENRKIEACWNSCTSYLDFKSIENDLLRSTLFQYTICKYLRDVLKNEVVFICRQDENTVHHLLEEKISVEEVLKNPNVITEGSATFDKKAFINYINELVNEGSIVTSILFDNKLKLLKDLEEIGTIVFDGRLNRENRYSFYEQALRKGVNALQWKKQNLPIADGILPSLDLKRFWPIIKPVSNHLITKDIVEKSGAQTKEWNYDSIRDCLIEIWMDYLDLVEQPDLNDDFFKIGGTSLIGLDVLTEVENEMGVVMSYQDLFDYSVLESMINHVLNSFNQSLDESKSKSKSSSLDSENRSKQYKEYIDQLEGIKYSDRWNHKKIMVTGGTGFLGAFLIEKLLSDSSAQIVCLVRGNSLEDAENRFKEQYLKYFESYDENRICVVCGDITNEGLLSNFDEKNQLNDIDAVYHSAGIVVHYGKYEKSHQINVLGTKKIFNWALENNVKVFNHMSTLAVSEGKIEGVEESDFYEFDLDLGQEFNGLVYPKSKFLAEQYITKKNTEMKVNIFRLGNIGGRLNDGLFQSNIETNNVYLMLKAIAQTGRFADLIKDVSIEFEPVDKVVKAISTISMLKSNIHSTFHLFDYRRYYMSEIVKEMRGFGVEIMNVSNEELVEFYEKITAEGNLGKDYTSIGILKHTFLSDFTISNTYFDIHNKATLKCLEFVGLSMDYDRSDYLKKIIKHGINCGFIPVKKTTKLIRN